MSKVELPKINKEEYNIRAEVGGIVLGILFIISLIWPVFLNTLIDKKSLLAIRFISQITLTIIAILSFKNKLKKDLKIFISNFRKYVNFNILKLMAMVFIAGMISKITLSVTNQDASVNQANLNNLPIWYYATLAVLLAPIVEECLFRGVIRRYIKSDVPFIAISAVLFGAAHAVVETSLSSVILNGLPYVIYGAFFAYFYAKSNNLVNSMFAHLLINTIAVLGSL